MWDTTSRRIASGLPPGSARRSAASYCFQRAAIEAAGLRAADGWIKPQKIKPFWEALSPASRAAAEAAAERLGWSLLAYRKPSASTWHSSRLAPTTRVRVAPRGGTRGSLIGRGRCWTSRSPCALVEASSDGGWLFWGAARFGAETVAVLREVLGLVRGWVIFTAFVEAVMTSTERSVFRDRQVQFGVLVGCNSARNALENAPSCTEVYLCEQVRVRLRSQNRT
jgi:hypothetical protein